MSDAAAAAAVGGDVDSAAGPAGEWGRGNVGSAAGTSGGGVEATWAVQQAVPVWVALSRGKQHAVQ